MRSRARAARWHEEVILLEEEMRRVLEFCNWKAQWWRERVAPVHPESRGTIGPELAEGLHAYACEQVHREQQWAATWERKWAPVHARVAVVLRDGLVDVAEDLLVPIEVELDDAAAEEEEYGLDDVDDHE